jgi:hypothetical protein
MVVILNLSYSNTELLSDSNNELLRGSNTELLRDEHIFTVDIT